ncbi:MAG: hypothetical protein FWC58_11930, partial [Desulfobulbus sp.]|nr:hypothetical protein [Desulfobulbus sp.]
MGGHKPIIGQKPGDNHRQHQAIAVGKPIFCLEAFQNSQGSALAKMGQQIVDERRHEYLAVLADSWFVEKIGRNVRKPPQQGFEMRPGLIHDSGSKFGKNLGGGACVMPPAESPGEFEQILESGNRMDFPTLFLFGAPEFFVRFLPAGRDIERHAAARPGRRQRLGGNVPAAVAL